MEDLEQEVASVRRGMLTDERRYGAQRELSLLLRYRSGKACGLYIKWRHKEDVDQREDQHGYEHGYHHKANYSIHLSYLFSRRYLHFSECSPLEGRSLEGPA